MNLRIVDTILRKELLDTLRDKRTLLMMVGVPLILYPATMLIAMQALLVQKSAVDRNVSRVAITATEPALVESWLQAPPKEESNSTGANSPAKEDAAPLKYRIVASEHPGQDLAEGNLDAVIVVTGDSAALHGKDGTVPVEIQFDATEFNSRGAEMRISKALDKTFERMQRDRLKEASLPESFVKPLSIKSKDMAPPTKRTGYAMGLILPMLMILTLALGAFYPAVDLTAGEKERGTFETLLSTPVSKLDIVTGKFLTVFILAMAAGLLNLISMAATFFFMVSQAAAFVGNNDILQIQVPIHVFPVILLAIVPLAFFISALMMSVAVLARSFKEAQNYLTPFFMVILVPAMIAGFPGMQLNPLSQFFPIANVILLFKELMVGTADPQEIFAVFFSTIMYAVLSLFFAAWLFQREEVVLSEDRGFPLSLRRGDFIPRDSLTPGGALTFFALAVVLIAYIGSLAQQANLIAGLLATEWLIILAPVLFVLWFMRVNLRKALMIAPASLFHFMGAVIMAASAMLLMASLSTWQNKVLPLPEDFKKVFESLFSAGGNSPGFVMLLLAAALSPAVCEEVLFRGAILTGLRQRMNVWAAVLTTGVLFGLFHLSIYRVLPTAIIGVMLSYIAVRSRSIFPAMAAHLVFNGLGILTATGHIPARVVASFEHIETEGLSATMWACALIGLSIGLVLLHTPDFLGRNHRELPGTKE